MNGYMQLAIGVLVSIFLFIISYRKTVGARKERVRSTNRSIYRALLRRMVLEGYKPTLTNINNLIDGKAIENHGGERREMGSGLEISVYTKLRTWPDRYALNIRVLCIT